MATYRATRSMNFGTSVDDPVGIRVHEGEEFDGDITSKSTLTRLLDKGHIVPSGGSSTESETSEPEPSSDGDSTLDEVTYPYHEGSGWYLLSNGEKVRGRSAAEEAQDALDENEEE